MLISNNNFLFVFLLLLNIIVISKSSTDYVFLKPSKEEMLNIKSLQPVEYEGIIEAIENSFEIYFFSTSYIEEDKDGNYINYIDKFTIIPGYTHNISNGKRFMIIMGTGFISFGATEKTEIKLAKLKTITLPFYLNNKYFKLVGNGNTFEIGVDNPNVCVYINNYCYYKNYTLTGLSNGQIVIIRNFNNAKNEKINLLFSYRKDDYLIDKEKGDSISYYFPQTFIYYLSSSLNTQYINREEGILMVTGKQPEVVLNGVNKYYYKNGYYYILPYKSNIKVTVTTKDYNGVVSVRGVTPTILINFPDTKEQKIVKGIGPQYVRISIDSNFNEEYNFKFGSNVEFFEGKMFTSSGYFNGGTIISSKVINKNNSGKVYTAIYTSSGTFKAEKIYNFIELKKNEIKKFDINPGNEIAFSYSQTSTSSTIVKFEYGYQGEYIKIYVYYDINEIQYNPKTKTYSNYREYFKSWDEIILPTKKVYLIIQSNIIYSDYISFRNDDLTLENETPKKLTFSNNYNLVSYKLQLESGENAVEISLNFNIFEISLYKSKTKIDTCNKKLQCIFNFINDKNYNYYIYIKNIIDPVKSDTFLYILLYQILEYYPILGNEFIKKNFLFSFENKFKLDSSYLSNIINTKELVITSQTPLELENYFNFKISFNIQDNSKTTSETINNNIYKHYYLNLINQKDISNIIVTVTGTWITDIISSGYISFSYGGPYYSQFPSGQIKEINNFEGSIIYFTFENSNPKDKYLFGISTSSKIIKGKLFNDKGELNTIYMDYKKYILNNDLFENNSKFITIEYKIKNTAIANYEKIDGQILLNKNKNEYKTLQLDFQNNNVIYYLGLYDSDT